MTVEITINPSDVSNTADFLEQYLTDAVTEGDFSKGTALRDIAVQALATIVTFLRADATQIRQMQSLLSGGAATGGRRDRDPVELSRQAEGRR
jgi:hypothetical protein